MTRDHCLSLLLNERVFVLPRFEKLLDTNSLIMELFSMAPRWTAARMDLMSSTLVLFLALLILLNKENIFSAAIAAMALQQAIGVRNRLPFYFTISDSTFGA